MQRYHDLASDVEDLRQRNQGTVRLLPPRYSHQCRGDARFRSRDVEQQQQTDDYTASFLRSELRLLKELRFAGQQLDSCSSLPASVSAESRAAVTATLARIILDDISAVRQSLLSLPPEEQNERTFPVISALARAVNNLDLDDVSKTEIKTTLNLLVKSLLDTLIVGIQQNHDFRFTPLNLKALLDSAPLNSLLSNQEKLSYLENFHRLFIFRVKVSNTVAMNTPLSQTSIGAGLAEQRVDLFSLESQGPIVPAVFSYESGQFTTANVHGVLSLPLQFQTSLQFEISACSESPQLKLRISKLGADVERFQLDNAVIRELPGMMKAWNRVALTELRKSDGSFEISIPLNFNQSKLIEFEKTTETLAENGRISANIAVQLNHTPEEQAAPSQ